MNTRAQLAAKLLIVVLLVTSIFGLTVLLNNTGQQESRTAYATTAIAGLTTAETSNETLVINETVNQPPKYTGPSILNTTQDMPVMVDLLLWHTDPENDTLTFLVTEEDQVNVTLDGSIATFAPAAGFVGERIMTIAASDDINLLRTPLKFVVESTEPSFSIPVETAPENTTTPVEAPANETEPINATPQQNATENFTTPAFTTQDEVTSCNPTPVFINTSTSLSQNLVANSGCIIFNADNIFLNCSGFNITYGANGSTNSHAIVATNRTNVTVRDCTILDNASGGVRGIAINFSNTSNSFILNNTINTSGTNDNYGILIHRNGSNNTIANNTVRARGSTTANYGIMVIAGVNNTIIDNVVNATGTSDADGIRLTTADNNTVMNNVVNVGFGSGATTGNDAIELDTAAVDNLVINNNVRGNGTSTNRGIFVFTSANNNRIINNTAVGDGSGGTNNGIRIDTSSNNNLVWNNTLVGGRPATGNDNYGVSLLTTVRDNNITDNRITARGGTSTIGNPGISMSGASNTTVMYNVIQAFGSSTENFGIYVISTSLNNTIAHNLINTTGTSANYGIFFQTTVNNNTIWNNTINTRGTTTDNYGIYLFSTVANNSIVGNRIDTNGTTLNHGIVIDTTARNNTIEHTNITARGTTTDNYGIYLTNSVTGTMILNVTINTTRAANNYGIRADTVAENTTIIDTNITTTGNDSFGVYLSSIRGLTMERTNISSPAMSLYIDGTVIEHFNTHSISNTSNANGTAINYYGSTGASPACPNNQVIINHPSYHVDFIGCSNVTFTDADHKEAITLISTNHSVINYTIIARNRFGVRVLFSATNNTIAFTNITVNTTQTDNYGVQLAYFAQNTTVSNNTIVAAGVGTANNFGIYLFTNANNNLMIGNQVNTSGTTINAGIRVESSSNNNTIRNNTITAGGTTSGNYGIALTDTVSDNTVNNNTVRTNGTTANYGIYLLTAANGNAVGNNTVIAGGFSTGATTGIRLESASNHNMIENNSVSTFPSNDANNDGIRLTSGPSNNTIRNNLIITNGTSTNYGIQLTTTAQNNTIINNIVRASGTTTDNYGIYLTSTTNHNNITGNIINTSGSTDNYGIILQSSANNNSITNNIINTLADTATNHGIYLLTNVENSTVHNNAIYTRGTNTNNGIRLESTVRNNTVTNNTITTNGSGTTNYGIYLTTAATRNNITRNVIYTAGTSNNTGILLDTQADNNTIADNAINATGTAANNFGIQLLTTSRRNNITGNRIATTGLTLNHGIILQNNANNNSFTANNITTNRNESYAIFILRANTSFFNHTLFTEPIAWLNSSANNRDNIFDNTTFRTRFGNIRIVDRFGVNGTQHIGQSRLNVTQNRAFLNSSNLTFLNQSGQIVLNNIVGDDPTPIVDLEDDGSFVDCLGTFCTEDSYANNIFVFNVTQFTAYSSSAGGGVNLTLSKADNPDPASTQINYTITINVTFGNASNITLTEQYPTQTVFDSAQPQPSIGNSLFIIGNVTAGSMFVLNVTVNISSGIADGAALTNLVNITYQNSTGNNLTLDVTEITTFIANFTTITNCSTINSSTKLANNASSQDTCIRFSAHNIYLDCAGFSITYGTNGTRNDSRGILVESFQNASIRNCTIRKGNATGGVRSYGIVLLNATLASIENTTVLTNGSGENVGVYLGAGGGNGSLLSRNYLVKNPGNVNNAFCTNTLNNVNVCKVCIDDPGVTCTNLGATGCPDTVGFRSDTLLNFTLNSSALGGGISVLGGEGVNCTLNGNTVIFFGVRGNCGSPRSATIPASYFLSGENTLVCAVAGWGTDPDAGFKLTSFFYEENDLLQAGRERGQNVSIRNATIIAAGGNESHGIFVDIQNVTIVNTTITTNGTSLGHGIALSTGARNAIIQNNTIAVRSTGSDGINIVGSTRNTFLNNSIVNYTRAAVYIEYALNNTFNQTALRYLTNRSSLFILETHGIINFSENITFDNQTILSDVVNISLNFTQINTTRQGGQQLNKSAFLEFFGISFLDSRAIVDFEDDLTFANCAEPQCLVDDYNPTTYTMRYNVSSFTTYAAADLSACGTLALEFPNTAQVFTLYNNVSAARECFNITDDNITLNCNGYAIYYDSSNGANASAINIINPLPNTTIQNITIRDCTILKNGSSGDESHGIIAVNTTNISLQNSTINTTSPRSHGILLVNSYGATLANLTIQPEEDALRVEGTEIEHWSTHEIHNSTNGPNLNISYYGGAGASPACPNNQILSRPAYRHITLVRCTNVTINEFNSSDRVTIVDSNYTVINSSVIVNNTRGIGVFFSRHTVLSNNTITTERGVNNHAIQVIRSNVTNITASRIHANGSSHNYGIVFIGPSTGNNVSFTNITTNGTRNNIGIVFENTVNSTIHNNTIVTNGTGGPDSAGIRLNVSSADVTIAANVINATGNHSPGIAILESNRVTVTTTRIKYDFLGFGSDGIALDRAEYPTISNNVVEDMQFNSRTAFLNDYGINMTQDVNFSRIVNNTIITNGSSEPIGIYIRNGSHTQIIDNTILTFGDDSSDEAQGMRIEFDTINTTIYRNTIETNGGGVDHGILVQSGHNQTRIIENFILVRSNNGFGIDIIGSNDQNDRGIVIHNNTIIVQKGGSHEAIWIDTVGNVTITDNSITVNSTQCCSAAIDVEGNNAVISENRIYMNGTSTNGGIGAIGNSTVFNNSVSVRGSASDNIGIIAGVSGSPLTNVRIYNNSVTTNGTSDNYGIYIPSTSYFVVANNTIRTHGTEGSNYGIYVLGILGAADSLSNNITNNTITTYGTVLNHGIFINTNVNHTIIINNTIVARGTTDDNYGIYLDNGVFGTNISENTVTADSGSFFGIGINVDTNSNYTFITNNTIRTNGSSNLNVGIYLFQRARSTTIAGNVIFTNGTNSNYGITLDTDVLDSVIENNTIFTNGSSNFNYGIVFFTNASRNNITNNIIVTNGTDLNHGVRLQSGSHDNLILNTRINTTGNASYGISINESNNTNATNIVMASSEWIHALINGSTDNITLNRFFNVTFEEPNGGIQIFGFFQLNGTQNISKQKLNITLNRAFLNSTNLTYLNQSAQITLRSIGGVDPAPTVNFSDGATFAACPATICTEVSFNNGVFVYNVTQFTTYSSTEGNVNITLSKIDTPDPVVEGQLLNYTIVINVSMANASNITVTDLYPPQVIFINSSPTNITPTNNTFIIGNVSQGSSFSLNITVLVNNGTAGIVINNTANISYQNTTGNTLFFNVTENTTISSPPLFNVSNITITKTDLPDPVNATSLLNYTIFVNNTGNGTAANVTVNETYPIHVAFNASQPDALTGINNTWILGNLTAGTNFSINITVTVLNWVSNGTVINNSVTAGFQNETSQVHINRTATIGTTVLNDNITNSFIANCTIINSNISGSTKANCTIINSTVINSTNTNSNITNSTEINSTDRFSNVVNSTIIHSDKQNSNINNSNITTSNITNSNITNCVVINSTVVNSIKINCTIINSIIRDSNNTNATIIDSTETNSTDNLTTVINSTIAGSVKLNSNISNNSNIVNSTITNSTIVSSNLTNTTETNSSNQFSVVFNSTILNSNKFDSTINNSNLSFSNVSSCFIMNGTLDNAIKRNCTIINSIIINSNNTNATLINSSEVNSSNFNTTVIQSNLTTAVKHNSSINSTTVINSTIINGTVTNSTINNTNLTNCIVVNSTVVNSIKTNCTIIRSTITAVVTSINTNSTTINTNETNSNNTNVIVDGSNITGSTKSGGTINNSIVINSNSTNSTLTNSTVVNSNVTNCVVINSTILDSQKVNCTIINSNIINSTNTNASIINSNETNGTDTNTVVDGVSIISNTTKIGSTLNNTNATGSNITGSDLINSTITNSNITNSNLTGCTVTNSTIIDVDNSSCTYTNTVVNGSAGPQPQPPPPPPAVGGGGGGNAAQAQAEQPLVIVPRVEIITPAGCVENWECTDWSTCTNDLQERQCVDVHGCNATSFVPKLSRACPAAGLAERLRLPGYRVLVDVFKANLLPLVLAILALALLAGAYVHYQQQQPRVRVPHARLPRLHLPRIHIPRMQKPHIPRRLLPGFARPFRKLAADKRKLYHAVKDIDKKLQQLDRSTVPRTITHQLPRAERTRVKPLVLPQASKPLPTPPPVQVPRNKHHAVLNKDARAFKRTLDELDTKLGALNRGKGTLHVRPHVQKTPVTQLKLLALPKAPPAPKPKPVAKPVVVHVPEIRPVVVSRRPSKETHGFKRMLDAIDQRLTQLDKGTLPTMVRKQLPKRTQTSVSQPLHKPRVVLQAVPRPVAKEAPVPTIAEIREKAEEEARRQKKSKEHKQFVKKLDGIDDQLAQLDKKFRKKRH